MGTVARLEKALRLLLGTLLFHSFFLKHGSKLLFTASSVYHGEPCRKQPQLPGAACSHLKQNRYISQILNNYCL